MTGSTPDGGPVGFVRERELWTDRSRWMLSALASPRTLSFKSAAGYLVQ